MKTIPTQLAILFLLLFTNVNANINNEFGYYLTKEDYLNKKVTIIKNMQESENYNVGELMYKDKKNVEHKISCLKEKYWGFRYIDSCDYMYMDGFFAKIVLLGRINLLISPKASFKIDENGKYIFNKTDDGKLNFYYMRELDPTTQAPFEKMIADEKLILKEYQADRDNYGEFINKQMMYLKKYNETIPKAKKGAKK